MAVKAVPQNSAIRHPALKQMRGFDGTNQTSIMKTYRTTIEIDDVEVNIEIEFKAEFGEVEINLIKDLETGLEIKESSIDRHILDSLYNKVYEDAADTDGFIELENSYANL